jgi:hypothetical protein
MTAAVLLLMHQGNSFSEEIAEFLRPRGMALLAVTSRPEKAATFEKQKPHLADWIAIGSDRVAESDVAAAIDTFSGRGYSIVAAIATFEGYRLLMAEANRALGARDSAVEALRRCLHKYGLRQFLFEQGLSRVRCLPVIGDTPPALDPSVTWFVKPVRGAASFASFILKSPDDFRDLPRIQEQMRGDHRMSAIFMDQYDFLVEEYVEGPEFSFEVVALGEPHHICVHEKARVEWHARTTLEAMSVTPPTSLDRDTVVAGARFVSRCLTALGLDAGAFHVEAKHWTRRKRWEIIEINPRMGGSLINASVKTVTDSSILELWLDSLLVKGDGEKRLAERLRQVSQLAALERGTVAKAAVFLSKYGEKGKTVESIRFAPEGRAPQILKIHVEKGTVLENSDRAICLLDALWPVEYASLPSEVDLLDRLANDGFRVEYRAAADPAPATRLGAADDVDAVALPA